MNFLDFEVNTSVRKVLYFALSHISLLIVSNNAPVLSVGVHVLLLRVAKF